MSFKSIGKNTLRIDGIEKTTGDAVFTADMKFPGTYHIKVLRSPYAHAVIKSIDTSEAKKQKGIITVLTGEDVPGPFGVAVRDQYPIARDRARFAGEPVAVAVGVTERDANEALKFIKVEYEPLPFAIHPKDALAEDFPVIHENLMDYKVAPYVNRKGKNIYQHLKVRKGDVDSAFEECDVVVEDEFWFPYIHHVQMEPHCAVAKYEQDHSIRVYASTQAPFVVQECVAELLEIPFNKVQVIAPYLGGGFGGKSDITIEALVAAVARAVPGHFVRLALTREEMFIGTSLGRGGFCNYKLGFKKDGTLVAMHGESYLASGGNGDYAVNIVTGMANAGTGPYEVKNLKLNVYGIYTNTPPIGAARGYGHPEVHLPVERLMDYAAKELNMTPAELRLKNLLREGRTNGIGQVMQKDNGDFVKCTEKIVEELYKNPKPIKGKNIIVGRGIAAYMKTPCMPPNVQSGATIKLNADGTVTLATGAIEMGQGTYTALSQIAAEALDIPVEAVNFFRGVDTFLSPYEWQTVASHTTWGVGNAITIAADDLKQKLKHEAAIILGAPSEDDVILENREAKYNGKSVKWSEFALGYRNPNGSAMTRPIMGEGYFVAQGVENPHPETGQGNAAADWTMGCVGAEIGIDKNTGEINIYRLLNVIDAGTIINPQIAHDQVVGAMTMSIGSALSEVLVFSEDKGAIRNNTLVDYKIPGIEDLPEEINISFVQTPEHSGPYGAKGIGEHGAVSVAPAILNAINDAISYNFTSLPVTADRIISALKGEEKK